MDKHLVVGAGGIGRATAAALAARGHRVALASRSGTDPALPGVTAVALDASDAESLVRAADGAASVVNALNPKQYHQWARDWPPVATALLAAAEKTGAGLVTVSNLYMYGEVQAPMREDSPMRPAGKKGAIRARMWADAKAAHDDGRLRATELRASDYFGPGAGAQVSLLNTFVVARAARGRTAWLPTGVPDAPHSWTYLADIGELAAVLATDDRSWGQVWHVPTSAPRTLREVATESAALAGARPARVRVVPGPVKRLLRVDPTVRELDETRHQFERPFVLDSRHTEAVFGLAPTPWESALGETVAALRG